MLVVGNNQRVDQKLILKSELINCNRLNSFANSEALLLKTIAWQVKLKEG